MDRPTSVTVFGVLNTVLGVWGLMARLAGCGARMIARNHPDLAALIQENPVLANWAAFGSVAGFVAPVALILAGIGLLGMKPWGRLLSLVHAVYKLVHLFIGLVIGLLVGAPLAASLVAQQGIPEDKVLLLVRVMVIVAALAAMVYPALLLVFMTRRRVREAFGAGAPSYP